MTIDGIWNLEFGCMISGTDNYSRVGQRGLTHGNGIFSNQGKLDEEVRYFGHVVRGNEIRSYDPQ